MSKFYIFIGSIAIIINIYGFKSIHEIQYNQFEKYADYSNYTFVKQKPLQKTKGLKYTYYGYLPYWIDTLYYDNFQYELLTDIAYFSINLDTNGNLGALPNAYRYNRAYSDCRKYGIDIHMTITLFGSSSVSAFLNDSIARDNGINNIVSLINTYDLDGINIDFEFVTLSVKDSFVDFINKLSSAVHNHINGRKELYIAMPAVPSWYTGYDYYQLGLYADGLFVMAYDYHYSGSSNAGPVAPTYNSDFWGYYAVNTSIGDYLAEKVSSDKIVLGIPYYGYDWPTESDTLNSPTTGSGTAVIYKNAKSNASLYNREWDNNSYTPFYDYYSTQWHQCWYDDSLSINAKLNIAKDSLLQGAGCWALGYDDGENDLWNEIRNVFWYEPPISHFIIRVNTAGLNARKGPGTQYDILSVIYENELYPVFDAKGNWYKIYFPSASGPYYAWIYGGDGTSLQYIEGYTQDSLIRITANLLNIRSGPTTDSSIITQTSRGQCFSIDSTYNGWAKLFLADDNKRGWVYYGPYSNMIIDPEDSNNYNITIDSIIYPDTVNMSDDSFLVNMYISNNDYGVIDSLVRLSCFDFADFYHPTYWFDSSNVFTKGFNGIINQQFSRYAIMKIPIVNDTMIISDTFALLRKGNILIDTIIVSTVVCYENLNIKQPEINSTFENTPELYNVKIYDVLGRLIDNKQTKHLNFNKLDLKPGIYFIIVNNKIKIKFIKINSIK